MLFDISKNSATACFALQIGSVTERGCLGSATDALECDSTENCQTCAIENGAACNKAIFPTDRIQCVVGDTADQYCPNPADSCVQIANNGNDGVTVPWAFSAEVDALFSCFARFRRGNHH